MIDKIKKNVEDRLKAFTRQIDSGYRLDTISPILSKSIKNYLGRPGKRIRPILFVLGYLGFAGKEARGLYDSAIAFELLHDSMLIHDDIIDRSDLRRGLPSMHRIYEKYLGRVRRPIKFNGTDLAIVAGDVVDTMAAHTFLSIRADAARKEAALKKFAEMALYTCTGEFVELVDGIKSIDEITAGDIYKVYDLKTANYTFSSPLSIGATIAGASARNSDALFAYGTYMGRAFQIRDDILDMFVDEKETGKSAFTDLKESKKTLLLWYAYHHTTANNRSLIKRALATDDPPRKDLTAIRDIVISSGALKHAKSQIAATTLKAQYIGSKISMIPRYKKALDAYCRDLLAVYL